MGKDYYKYSWHSRYVLLSFNSVVFIHSAYLSKLGLFSYNALIHFYVNNQSISINVFFMISAFISTLLRGEKLNYKFLAKGISKPPFLASEVQWASKFTVLVRLTVPLNVSNHANDLVCQV